MQSLRFRVPAIFLAGITVAALVTGGFALQLFLDYNEDKTLSDLRRQAEGLAELYATRPFRAWRREDRHRALPRPCLEEATGTRLYYAGVEIFLGQISACGGSTATCSTGRWSRRARCRRSSSSRRESGPLLPGGGAADRARR